MQIDIVYWKKSFRFLIKKVIPHIITGKLLQWKENALIKRYRYPIHCDYAKLNISQDVRVTIIIPTRNAGPAFDELLSSIRNQKGIPQIEIIVLDNESTDNTVLIAQKYSDQIKIIPSSSFNHGTTRNIGSFLAHGTFLVFTVQDVIIPDPYWLYRMIAPAVLYDLAAVTCRQKPRYDADLFSRFHNEMYYKKMGFHSDHYVSVQKIPLSDSIWKKLAHLDNVSCCYKKEIFKKYQFLEIPIAEDLEIGMRMAKDGQRLGFLCSNPVIHSHSRSHEYWLVRAFADRRSIVGMPQVMKDYTPDDISFTVQKYQTYYFLLSCLLAYAGTHKDILAERGFLDFFDIHNHDRINDIPSMNEKNLINEIFSLLEQYTPVKSPKIHYQEILSFFLFLFSLFSYIREEDNETNLYEFTQAALCFFSLHLGAFLGTLSVQLPDTQFITRLESLFDGLHI